MAVANGSQPVMAAKPPSKELDSELAKLTGNLEKVQDTFLNHWMGDQLQQTLLEHKREHQAAIQQCRDEIKSIQKELQGLQELSLSNKQVDELNHKRLQEIRTEIESMSAKLQQLLFGKEENEREYKAEMEAYKQQKELIEAQGKATKLRLKELYKAENMYKRWLGLQFKNIGGEQLQFAFSKLDPSDHARVFYFTIKIENNQYNVLECKPALNDLDKMVADLNETNNLMEFVVKARRKFKDLL